jgi:hypothetical protein
MPVVKTTTITIECDDANESSGMVEYELELASK